MTIKTTFLCMLLCAADAPQREKKKKRRVCLLLCAVDYVQRKRLRDSERAVLHRAKLLAAARQELEQALASGAGRGSSPANEAQAVEDSEEGASATLEPIQQCTHSVKRPVDYPWDWVSPQLLNRKGEEIYYPVVDDNDRSWARRLEWAINHHRDLAQSDLDGLQAECERVLRRSQSAAVRRDEQYYIKSLRDQLEDAHKRLRDARA